MNSIEVRDFSDIRCSIAKLQKELAIANKLKAIELWQATNGRSIHNKARNKEIDDFIKGVINFSTPEGVEDLPDEIID